MARLPRLMAPFSLVLVVACGGDTQGPDGGPGLELTVTPASLVLEAGTTDTLTAEVRRPAGNSAPLSFRLEGTGGVVRVNLLGATSSGGVTKTKLLVEVPPAAAAQTYSATLTAVAGDQTSNAVSLPIRVTPAAPAGNVVVDFRECAPWTETLWVAAYHPGTGGWQQVIGADGQYRFVSDSILGGVAFASRATTGSSGIVVSVLFRTAAELRSLPPESRCPSGWSGAAAKSVWVATTAPPGPDAHGGLGVASVYDAVVAGDNALALLVPHGSFDLVGLASSAKAPSFADPRMVVVRDLDTRVVSPGGRLAIVDFNGPQAFSPDLATVAVPGVTSLDAYFVALLNQTSCFSATYQFGALGGNQVPVFTLPASIRRPSDRYRVSVHSGNWTVQATETFDDLAGAATVALPSRLPRLVPVSLQTSPYLRMMIEFEIAPDVDIASFQWFEETFEPVMSVRTAGSSSLSAGVMISASRGYLGGSRVQLAMPDFKGVRGWDDRWAGVSNLRATYSVDGHSGPVGPCGPRRTFRSVGYVF